MRPLKIVVALDYTEKQFQDALAYKDGDDFKKIRVNERHVTFGLEFCLFLPICSLQPYGSNHSCNCNHYNHSCVNIG